MADTTLSIIIKAKDEASGIMKEVGGASDGLGSKLKTLAIAAAGAVAAYASLSQLDAAISSTQALGESVRTLSMQTGLSAEESSHYIFMLHEIGLGAEDAEKALGIFAKNIDTHSKSTAESLARIGVSATDAQGRFKSVNDLLPEISDHFRTLSDGSLKTATAMELFGKSGKDMIPFLDLGSKAMADMAAEADKLGVTLSAGNVEKIHQYTMAQRQLSAEFEGLKVKVALEVMPALVKGMEILGFAIDHAGQIFHVFIDIVTLGAAEIFYHWSAVWGAIGPPVVSAMNGVLGVIHDAVDKIISLINKVIDGFNSIKIDIPGMTMPGSIPNIPGFSFGGANIPNIPGVGGDWTVQGIAGGIGNGLSAMNDALDKYKVSAPEAAAATEDLTAGLAGGSGGGGLTAAEKAAQQGLIDMALAFADFHAATGLGEQDFMALIKMSQDRADMDKRAADAAVQLRTNALEAADAGFTLEKALVGIAEDAAKSGNTIQQEMAKLWDSIVSGIQSAFSAINGSQTKEGAALQLKIDQLTLKKDQLTDPSSAAGKAIQAQIDALNRQKTLTDDRNRIEKDLFDVANQTLPTEKQKLLEEQMYIGAQQSATATLRDVTAVAALQQIAQENYIAALNNASGALGGTNGFSAAQMHWINGVALGKGEPVPFPGYAMGTPYVPQTGLYMLHKGEAVTPAGQNRGSTYNMSIDVHVNGDVTDRTVALIKQAVRDEAEAALRSASFRGSYVMSGAYAPS